MHKLLNGTRIKLELGVFGFGLGIVKWLATGGFSLSTVEIRWEVHSYDNLTSIPVLRRLVRAYM